MFGEKEEGVLQQQRSETNMGMDYIGKELNCYISIQEYAVFPLKASVIFLS
jgi:hypothetical protein